MKSNNNNRRSRTSISRQRNLPICSRKLIGFFFKNKGKFCFVPENKPTIQEPCCCRFLLLLLLLLKLHRSLEKTGAPLDRFATYWVLTDCVHQCTSPCCVEQRRHMKPLSQTVPDLNPNLHPKSRCTQISPSLTPELLLSIYHILMSLSLSFFLSFFIFLHFVFGATRSPMQNQNC
jgi:hypothetical protein